MRWDQGDPVKIFWVRWGKRPCFVNLLLAM
jgi:hypothetical protein